MANVSTSFKRAFLRSLFWDSEKAGTTLYDALKDALQSKVQHVGQGLFLVGSTAKGHSVAYQIPSDGRGYSPSEILESIEELLTRYENAVSALIAAGTPTPTDSQIQTEMLALLTAITEVYSDYTELRS